MDFLFVTIVAIAALSYFMISVEGFHWRAIPRRTARSSILNHARRSEKRNAIFVGSPPMATTALSDKGALLDDEEEESENNWTMEEDWVLIDNLPLFTVSSAVETRTFWTQLWSANGILFSRKQPEDLYRRAVELKEQRAVRRKLERQETKLQNTEKKNDPRQSQSSLTFGASPPVLENWKTDLESNDNRVVGQVGMKDSTGQRTIWFHYHVIGRLEGDPFADQSSSAVSLFPGGYIEAVGGRVYELGQPMALNEWGKETTNIMFNNKQEKIDANTAVRDNNDESSTISPWWLPGSTAAVSALVSSTILSACIGYSAGLSIVQDGSHHYQATSPTTPTMMLNSSSKAAAAGTKSSTISDSSYQLPSLEERRASTQYRVLREERLVKKISQRLEIDKQKLKQFEEQEQQQSSQQLLP